MMKTKKNITILQHCCVSSEPRNGRKNGGAKGIERRFMSMIKIPLKNKQLMINLKWFNPFPILFHITWQKIKIIRLCLFTVSWCVMPRKK